MLAVFNIDPKLIYVVCIVLLLLVGFAEAGRACTQGNAGGCVAGGGDRTQTGTTLEWARRLHEPCSGE